MAKAKFKKLNFEKGVELLEEIVEQLEDGELGLEESIKKYEEGMELYKECSKKLNDAREKIEVLLQKSDGSVETESLMEELGD